MGIGLDEHRAIHGMKLHGYRARQSLVGLSAYCKFLHPTHMYMLGGVRSVMNPNCERCSTPLQLLTGGLKNTYRAELLMTTTSTV